MRDLLDCRKAIDDIDNKIIELLKARQDVATDVAIYKLAHDQKIVDKTREGQKLNAMMSKAIAAGLSPSMVSELYERIMHHTVAYEQTYVVEQLNQKDIARSTSIAYLGTKGTYSHLAAHRYFEHFEGRMEEHSCASFDEIVHKVESAECEYGVLPIENSNSGSINESVDTLQNMQASIVGEIFYPIDHSLLSTQLKDAHSEGTAVDYSKITTIYSHPQPVAQCSKFIKEHLSHAKVIYTNSSSDAMEKVKSLNDPSCIAIGSKHAARYYELSPLVSDIANNKSNYTRFIVISATPIKVPLALQAKTTLLFCVKKYQPGSLINVLHEFSTRNLNLSKLYSRPLENKNRDTWEEIFFVDVDANLELPAMQECLSLLKEHTTHLSVLGCYVSDARKD